MVRVLSDVAQDGGVRAQRGLRAEATLQALQRAYAAEVDTFSFLDIKTAESFDRLAVIVAIAPRHEGETWRLVGFCKISEDLRTDIAKAVCNGLNRFLSLAFP